MESKNGALLYNDKLYTLKAALDKDKMRPVLQHLAQRFVDHRLQIHSLNVEVIRRRNQRCVIRYSLTIEPQSAKVRQLQWNVIGKVFKADRGERVFADMKLLWENGFSHQNHDGISMPRPLEFLPQLCLLIQEEVPGRSLKNYIKEKPHVEHFRLLARTLAKLHCTQIKPVRPFTVKEHLLRCHPRHPFLALACPDLSEQIDHIIEVAYAVEKKFGAIQFTPLHGDFHLGQIHVDNGHAWLIDFDGLSYGAPASDLGNILVFLKAKAKKIQEMSTYIDIFLQTYFEKMDPAIAERIPLYEGLTHLRRACKCLRFQEKGWQKKVHKMIAQGVKSIDELAEKVLH